MRILAIDDDKAYLDSKLPWLKVHGYDTAVAYSYDDAVQAFEKEAADIDIALIDMYMGNDKKAGLKLVILIAENYPWIVPVVLTAHTDLGDVAECMFAGAFNYLSKWGVPPEDQLRILKRADQHRRDYERRRALGNIADEIPDLQKALTDLQQGIHNLSERFQRVLDELARAEA